MSGGMTVSLGRWAVARQKAFGQLCAFLGETFVEGLGMLLRPRRFRFGDAALAFERACTDGLPITILIGLLLGLIEALGAGYIGDLTNGVFGSNYQDVFSFIVLILVLIFRPSGLLGERVGDRA